MIVGLTLSLMVSAAPEALSLQSFLDQVKTGNQNFVASGLSKNGAKDRRAESQLLYWPLLEAETSIYKDPLLNLAIPATLESQWKSSVALKQRTPLGVDVSAHLNFKQQDYSSFPTGDYTNSSLGVGFQASLWKNLLGAELRSKFKELKNRALAQSKLEQFTQSAILADAESRYASLHLARSLVASQKASLERAERLFRWVSRKSKVDLVTENALEQARANLAGKKAAYFSAVDLERASAQRFNSLRGREGDEVEPLSTQFNEDHYMKSPMEDVYRPRADFEARIHQAEEIKARALQAREMLKPDLLAFGEYNFQGQDQRSNRSGALGDALSLNDPQYTLGLKLVVPLGIPQWIAASQGYDAEAQAQSLRSQRLDFEGREEWRNLTQVISEARRQVILIREAEKAQKSRTEIEMTLFLRGRSTTLNLIQAEDDYSDVLIRRLEIESRLVNLLAQLKMFGGEPS